MRKKVVKVCLRLHKKRDIYKKESILEERGDYILKKSTKIFILKCLYKIWLLQREKEEIQYVYLYMKSAAH